MLARLLDGLGIGFEEAVPVPGVTGLQADFRANGVLVFISSGLTPAAERSLSLTSHRVLVVSREQLRSDSLDLGIRVVGLGETRDEQGIFLDDPSFNFDYSHILPHTRKCSVMHGHTSSVLVEIIGRPVDGMVVDFGEAKEIVRDAMKALDHKLFINEKYLGRKSREGSVTLKFKTVHGEFMIKAPKATTVLLKGEATVENLAREVLAMIAPKMPENVTAVGVYVYEGMNKGSHILARIHQERAAKQRNKR